MIPATFPVQRSPDAKLLVIDGEGHLRSSDRSGLLSLFRSGDAVVANDAATLPASLFGHHVATGAPIEVRLAGRDTLAVSEVSRFAAVVFGEGDYRTLTEDRPLPPRLQPGNCLKLGPLQAVILKMLHHPRFVSLRFDGSPREIWEGLARHGRPIQYSHIATPLSVWDTWTPIAALPVAFESPSAGFALDWRLLAAMAGKGVRFATITLAAGISSTGDAKLDARLPLDEPYRIPEPAAEIINAARAGGGRVIAIGTTVVRALEHAGKREGVIRAGRGVATQTIGPASVLHVVDAILSGTHERGTSHYQLLRAFADDQTLRRMDRELEENWYRTHEFGDSVFIEKQGVVKLLDRVSAAESPALLC